MLNRNKKTLLIAGSGASQNSWDSVIAGMKKVMPDKFITKENANFIFANLISEIRWLHYQAHNNPKHGEKCGAKLKDYKKLLDELKCAITAKLLEDQNSKRIYLDNATLELISKNYIHESKVGVATTNWDHLFEGLFSTDAIFYLHGSLSEPTGLYLPSEVIEDAHRTDKERSYLGNMAGSFMRELETVDQVIIYGLRFSPLDAELGTLWKEGFVGRSKPMPKVVLIDTKPQPVLETLKYLMPNVSPELMSIG